jgi:hypothetical protein
MAIQESIVPREGALLQQLAELWDLPRPDGV